jgi:hypothetical protein
VGATRWKSSEVAEARGGGGEVDGGGEGKRRSMTSAGPIVAAGVVRHRWVLRASRIARLRAAHPSKLPPPEQAPQPPAPKLAAIAAIAAIPTLFPALGGGGSGIVHVATEALKGPTAGECLLLKKVRKLRGGRSGAEVWLMERDVVLKSYPAILRPLFKRNFKRELAILERLVGCPFAPQLLAVDHKKLRLWITYCGPHAPANPDTIRVAEPLYARISSQWGVHHKFGPKQIQHVKLRGRVLNNITMHNNAIYLIDFAGPAWSITPKPTPNPH